MVCRALGCKRPLATEAAASACSGCIFFYKKKQASLNVYRSMHCRKAHLQTAYVSAQCIQSFIYLLIPPVDLVDIMDYTLAFGR
jgi:hypothetical protein